MTLAENIKRIRKEKGLTQKKLGELCGINESNIRKYESGKQNPKIETIEKIANALQCPVYELRRTPQTPAEEEQYKILDIINMFPIDRIAKLLPDPASNLEEFNDKMAKFERLLQKELENGTLESIEKGISLTDLDPLFDKLNTNGKKEAVKRIEELTHLKQYTDK